MEEAMHQIGEVADAAGLSLRTSRRRAGACSGRRRLDSGSPVPPEDEPAAGRR